MIARVDGTIRTLEGDFSRYGSRPVDLVFRTVGERTSELALELAIHHIRPNRVYVVENVMPWSRALAEMVKIEHRCSHVVYVDADCLILEDMRPFLDANELAYVDCYVQDRFRGRIHCGVHITRTDVVQRMRQVPVSGDDIGFMLSPESLRRRSALQNFHLVSQRKSFHILHDHFQHFVDIFRKYALRELRCRRDLGPPHLEASMARWDNRPEFEVARAAVYHARGAVSPDATPKQIEAYLQNLPNIAQQKVATMGLPELPPLTIKVVQRAIEEDREALGPPRKQPKVFGLGLSRTGIGTLTAALPLLGFDVAQYMFDRRTLEAMALGDGCFPLLNHYDSLVDIVTIPFLAELDALHPGARFILTVWDKEDWLRSFKNHWRPHPPFESPREEQVTYWEIQRFLQAAVYGCHEFNPTRLSRIYDEHVARVKAYFSGRPDDLLVLDIARGDGWEKLAPFLGCAPPDAPFPEDKK
jgi:Sulfotransferase domain